MARSGDRAAGPAGGDATAVVDAVVDVAGGVVGVRVAFVEKSRRLVWLCG